MASLAFLLSVALQQDGVEFFEKKIRPLLADRCYKCHSAQADKVKGGLLLDTREALLKGGDSGPAVVPGNPDKSLLVKAVRRIDEELQMPPKEKKLAPQEIADLEAWVKMGAPWPAAAAAKSTSSPALNLTEARKFWSFQPPRDPAIPTVKNPSWCRTPVDFFILSKLEEKGLKPAPEADKRTLLRRASFDLTGLPPTPEETDAYLADPSPDAWEKAIDRLLASPRYGERWGRHWLDLARYADTKEWVVSEERRLPYSYTYRDWVIQAFNDDLPYDQFVLQQLAADKLPTASDKHTLAALGFLTVGRTFLNRLPDIIDDRIDVVSRGLLGLTASCARCHDHKYDPIPTRDYYSLYGIFASAQTPKELPLFGPPPETPEYKEFAAELRKREEAIEKFKASRLTELVAKYRAPAQIADYLMGAHEARALAEEELKGFAQKSNRNTGMVRRWVAFLKKTGEGYHPVFGPWHAYAAIPEADFAAGSLIVTEEVAAGQVNPLVAQAFLDPPKSLRDVANCYGKLLAAFDKAQPLADRNEEALRLALCGPDAATAMPLSEVEQVLNNDDRNKIKDLKKKVDELHHHPGAPPRAMALEDTAAPHNPKVFIRGNASVPGDDVPRQFLAILSPDDRRPYKDGGRLEMARGIASKDNPLTTRVWANRVWHHHFGTGIVRTPSDFGARGERPTHPELLDWLAVRLVEGRWSTKKLHKLLMTSAVYRQSSDGDPSAEAADGLNATYWHFNRRRLELESMRDALLAAAGRLDLTMGGRSIDLTKEPFSLRRTIYGHVDRLNLANMFRVFDFAVPDMHAPRRYSTTVPQQALFMMNSPFVLEQAHHVAERVSGVQDPAERIRALYRTVYGRGPSDREVELGLKFVKAATAPAAKAPAWQYGTGDGNGSFTPLEHFTGSGWQGGAKLPDAKTGWALLTAQGGHAGDDQARAAIRRWTAPRDGKVTLSGVITHTSPSGDGIRARVVSSRAGALASWTVCRLEVETKLSGLQVKEGETIDFVVDCRGDCSSDSFTWAPVVKMSGPDEEWNAAGQFGPVEKAQAPLPVWEKYAQVLLEANEFVFVD